jgi:hypothetical protein
MDENGVNLTPNVLWLLGTFGSGFVAWLIWLTVQTFKNREDIKVNITNDTHIKTELDKIYVKIDEVKKEFHDSIDRMEGRLIREIGLIRGFTREK